MIPLLLDIPSSSLIHQGQTRSIYVYQKWVGDALDSQRRNSYLRGADVLVGSGKGGCTGSAGLCFSGGLCCARGPRLC
jgi:hypothetical protein